MWCFGLYVRNKPIFSIDESPSLSTGARPVYMKPPRPKIYLWIAIIAVLTALPYAQVWHHDYVHFDDYEYIVDNNYINRGITSEGFLWAMNFRQADGSYWRPITWFSHMLDFTLFGKNSGAHHMVNVVFHILNAILVFVLMYAMTAKSIPSLVIALVFGLHPLNVESVAWLTERSNVLSTFWGLMALLFYRQYTTHKTYRSYCLVIIFFLFSLMSKPLLITLPFLMLLIDYWPLARIKGVKGNFKVAADLVIEKIPLITFALVSVWLAMARVGDETISVTQVPFYLRTANAVVSYIHYLVKFIYPVDLAAFYPFPLSIPAWKTIGASVVLAATSILLFVKAGRIPAAFVGWFWYVGTLVPKIGLIQAGMWPALADRWLYFPGLGLSIMIIWPLGRWLRDNHKPVMRCASLLSGAGFIFLLIYLTWLQVAIWSNSQILFENMLKRTQNNYFAHNNLGFLSSVQGQNRAAEEHFRKAIDLNPHYEKAYFNMGVILSDQGKESEAIVYFRKAVALKPTSALNNIALGKTLVYQGQKEGMQYLTAALQLSQNSGEVYNIVRAILRNAGQTERLNPPIPND